MACCGKNIMVGGTSLVPHPWAEPQCLECIDKHLAKSMCRMEEALAIAQEKEIEGVDGYPSRFKIIGELDTAKKYSEAWPELQNTIIEAREKYKISGPPVDWEPIEKESAKVVCGEVDKSAYHVRFKIIGNLALAEEHSLKWPELHRAIREARKAFQTKGVVPDWSALEKASANVWIGEEVSREATNSAGQNSA